MTRRARFTQSEMDRLFNAAKRAGIHVRIVPTKDSLVIETIATATEVKAESTPPGLRVLEGKDIVF